MSFKQVESRKLELLDQSYITYGNVFYLEKASA